MKTVTALADESFTVLVRPLRFDTNDSAAVASVQQYYGFVLDELRSIPGLVLLVADSSTDNDVPTDFRLTVTGHDAGNTEHLAGWASWQVTLKAESWQGSAFRSALTIHSAGTLDPGSCPFAADMAVELCAPSGVAAGTIRTLRNSVFPKNPMLQDELQARLRTSDQSVAERNRTLLALLSQSRSGDAPLDGEVIRGVLELISNSRDANQRASLWRQLRGQKDPELASAADRCVP